MTHEKKSVEPQLLSILHSKVRPCVSTSFFILRFLRNTFAYVTENSLLRPISSVSRLHFPVFVFGSVLIWRVFGEQRERKAKQPSCFMLRFFLLFVYLLRILTSSLYVCVRVRACIFVFYRVSISRKPYQHRWEKQLEMSLLFFKGFPLVCSRCVYWVSQERPSSAPCNFSFCILPMRCRGRAMVNRPPHPFLLFFLCCWCLSWSQISLFFLLLQFRFTRFLSLHFI